MQLDHLSHMRFGPNSNQNRLAAGPGGYASEQSSDISRDAGRTDFMDFTSQNRDRVFSFNPQQRNPTNKKAKSDFRVSFKIKCVTEFGQCVAIVGAIPELGSWSEPLVLKWTDGHVWVTPKPIETRTPVFEYKYLLLEHGEKKWERGINRVADLRLQSSSCLEVDDFEFQKFRIIFSLYAPIEVGQQMSISIGGKAQSMRLNDLSSKEWLRSKYGEAVIPFEHVHEYSNDNSQLCNADKFTLQYTY